MTPEDIEADIRNSTDSRIEEVDGDTQYNLVVVQFQIEESMWNDIRNGTKAGMKALLDWCDAAD